MGYNYRETKALVQAELVEQREKAQNVARGRLHGEVLNIPIIMGPVGCGKTSVVVELAADLGLDVLGVNCGENGDPSDVAGMAVPWALERKGDKALYMQHILNKTLYTACEKPVMLFFDDVDKMPGIVEGALIGIFGKREARDRTLHPETLLVAAGNRVQDDRLAHGLSESLRTRATTIELAATLQDFADYAHANPTKVHPSVLGYLNYKKEHLHKQQDDVIRFPTQRGWVEASSQMFKRNAYDPYPGPKHHAWKTIIDLKCGDHVGSDFWAWYTIVDRVNVDKILTTGEIDVRDVTDKEREGGMFQYAATFAISQRLNTKKVVSSYTGLSSFVSSLDAEFRVSLLMQLNQSARDGIKMHFPHVGSMLLQDLITV